MRTNVWCDLTEHVVQRLGTGDLDALQRRNYLEHATNCIRCRFMLGDTARELLRVDQMEDAAIWPHLATATTRELALADESQRKNLLADVGDLALHLEYCESCAARLAVAIDMPDVFASRDHGCLVGRSAPVPLEWDSKTEGEIGWIIENVAVPLSIWTCRVSITERILSAELRVEPEHVVEWQTFAVTISSKNGLVAAVTFSPDQRRREMTLDRDHQGTWMMTAVLELPWTQWIECVHTTGCPPALRGLRSHRQAPFDLSVSMDHYLHDRVVGAVALAGQLLEDRAGRPVRCFNDGSILTGDNRHIGTWAIRSEDDTAVLVHVDADHPHALWLAAAAEDYGIEIRTATRSREPIVIAARFAAATTQRLSEHGRRYLERGRRRLELDGFPKTVIELREQREQLMIRWVAGRALRLKGESTTLDNRFRPLPGAKGDLTTDLNNALEWAD